MEYLLQRLAALEMEPSGVRIGWTTYLPMPNVEPLPRDPLADGNVGPKDRWDLFQQNRADEAVEWMAALLPIAMLQAAHHQLLLRDPHGPGQVDHAGEGVSAEVHAGAQNRRASRSCRSRRSISGRRAGRPLLSTWKSVGDRNRSQDCRGT